MKEPPEKSACGKTVIKCPKCGHEFVYAAAWLNISMTIGCPKCQKQFPAKDAKPE